MISAVLAWVAVALEPRGAALTPKQDHGLHLERDLTPARMHASRGSMRDQDKESSEKPGVATSPLAVSFAKINIDVSSDHGQEGSMRSEFEGGFSSEEMRMKAQMTAWTMSTEELQAKAELEREGFEAETFFEQILDMMRFFMYKADAASRTQVIMLTHLADAYSKKQVELLDQTFGAGRGVGFADLPAKNATGYIAKESLAYEPWTENDDEVLKGLNEMVPQGGLLLGRALQMFDANPDFDHAWIIENDVYFGDDSAQNIAELVQKYESSDADLIYAQDKGVGYKVGGQQFGDRWYFWDRCDGKFSGMLYAAFLPVMRVSKQLVGEIRAYVSEHKEAMFMECFIPTLARKKDLKSEGLDDTFAKYLRYRPRWSRADAQGALASGGKLVHPAKFGSWTPDSSEHVYKWPGLEAGH